jgi:S1-C subfamily serine protease
MDPTLSERVFQTASPSVVVVKSRGITNHQGSGVVVGPGMVATNRHVVESNYNHSVIYQGTQYPATIAYVDPEFDISLRQFCIHPI